MKLGRLPWRHIPDDELIANIRKSIRFIDRYRLWWILANVGMLVLGIWISIEAFRVVQGIGIGNANPAMLGFSIGAMIGLSASCTMHQLIFNVLSALANFRSERLLLRYYDAFNEGKADQDGFRDDDDE